MYFENVINSTISIRIVIYRYHQIGGAIVLEWRGECERIPALHAIQRSSIHHCQVRERNIVRRARKCGLGRMAQIDDHIRFFRCNRICIFKRNTRKSGRTTHFRGQEYLLTIGETPIIIDRYHITGLRTVSDADFLRHQAGFRGELSRNPIVA